MMVSKHDGISIVIKILECISTRDLKDKTIDDKLMYMPNDYNY